MIHFHSQCQTLMYFLHPFWFVSNCTEKANKKDAISSWCIAHRKELRRVTIWKISWLSSHVGLVKGRLVSSLSSCSIIHISLIIIYYLLLLLNMLSSFISFFNFHIYPPSCLACISFRSTWPFTIWYGVVHNSFGGKKMMLYSCADTNYDACIYHIIITLWCGRSVCFIKPFYFCHLLR